MPIPASGASTTRFEIGTPPSVQLSEGSVGERSGHRVHGTNRSMDIADVLEPWMQIIREQVPDLELFDAHTHLGEHDPDGMHQSPEELVAMLRIADARGAFVFPMHELDGYPPANDAVIAAAKESDGLLIPFCRIDPHDDALAEAERRAAAGARGIKLHPRAEKFTLDNPGVRPLIALAHERQLPVLIHPGRGIPALGLHAVELADGVPERTR